MLTVKKFNPISDIVYTQMPQDRYRFIEDGEDYDVALVRSAELGRTQFPKAPRAMDAPKNSAEPTAMPRARTRTAKVNRSRVPVRA